MLLSEIKTILNAQVLTGEDDGTLENIEINTACGSDLMSDVLAYVKDQSLLLTGLINSQVIRTAEMMDIIAICFVRGKSPAADVTALAKQKGVILMATDLPMYPACGRLYQKGLRGRSHAQIL